MSALEELLAPLPDHTRTGLLTELRKLSLHQDDDELFKLLKILSLYAAFYQSIPEAIREVHEKAIERIEALTSQTQPNASTIPSNPFAPLLEQLAGAITALENSTPPRFEEFRTTVENLQGSAKNIDRYSRELIQELRTVSARLGGKSPVATSTVIFTAAVSFILGVAGAYLLIRGLPL